jgi:hypothetical protein
VVLGEVAQLLGDPHSRVKAALLGHIAEPQPRQTIDRGTLPERSPSIRPDESEDTAHRGGLAGAIRPQEANEASRPGLEGGTVQGHDGRVALGEVFDLEHQ